MKIDVLSIGSFPAATNAELASRFAVTHHLHRPAPDVLDAALKGRIRAIATEANRGADRALIAALPKLEIISVFGVGVDSVDLAAARDHKIPVTNTPGVLADEVADLAIGLMLASARQILFADRYVRSGDWRSKGPIPLGRGVGGKTMGVVGSRRHRPCHRRPRRGLPHARRLSGAAPQGGRALRIRRRRGGAGAAERFPDGRLQGRAGNGGPHLGRGDRRARAQRARWSTSRAARWSTSRR